MGNLTFAPLIPLALWVPLAVGAALLLTWYAAASRGRFPSGRWPLAIALMTVVLIVPLVILLNPTWLERIPPPAGKPLLTILVDRSASMATRDGDAGRSRYEVASDAAREASQELDDRYEVRLRAFAESSTQVGPDQLAGSQPDGAGTDLAAAVEEGLDADRPQGQAVLLLSDGAHNTGGGSGRLLEAAAKAKAMAAPIYVKTLGGQAGVRDLEVALHMPQELAFVGQRVPIAVFLRQRGSVALKAELRLVRDGKMLDRRQASLKPDGMTETVFYVSEPTVGLYRYEIIADALAQEVTDLNNSATLLLRVVDQPVRVLLVEGKPYWDTKFLVRTLSADPSIELTSVVRMAEGRLLERKLARSAAGDEAVTANKVGLTSATRPESWTIRRDAGKVLGDPAALAAYQIVVLGRDAEVFLNDQALVHLKKWLRESEGSLVCFRGPPASQVSQRLSELMPVRWTPSRESRFRVRWTSLGQALRWLPNASDGDDALAGLPSLASSARAEQTTALAEVIAAGVAGRDGQETPVITCQPVGAGRVLVIEGAGMWRWAFLPPEYQKHDELYGTLWRSVIRWIVAHAGLLTGQPMALRTDKVTFSTYEGATATLLVRQPAAARVPEVELTGSSLAQPKRLTPVPSGNDPGQFRLPFGRLAEGRYSVRVVTGNTDTAACTTAFDVRGNLAERLEIRSQPGLMQQVAERSGGAVLNDVHAETVARRFDEHLALTRPVRVVRTSAWDRWWILLGTVAIWGASWGWRRRSGLV